MESTAAVARALTHTYFSIRCFNEKHSERITIRKRVWHDRDRNGVNIKCHDIWCCLMNPDLFRCAFGALILHMQRISTELHDVLAVFRMTTIFAVI